MKFFSPQRFSLSIGLVLLAVFPNARAQYTNGQQAARVWGQPSFTAGGAPATPTDGNLATPSGIAVDPATGKFFVADTANNRVLRYPSNAAFISGASAEIAFGQAALNLKVIPTTPTASSMSAPRGVTFDTSGNLWVADTGNHRVLKYANAATLPASGAGPAATNFFGQESATTAVATTSQRGMSAPVGLTFDTAGSLYIADSGNNRVLKFANAASRASYAFADGIFGQAALPNGQGNFLANAAGTSANALTGAFGVRVDPDGNLWVADTGNNRVLKFPSVTSQPVNGSAVATLVLGQANFTTVTSLSPPTAASLRAPAGLTFDPLGRLYVADTTNNRVLIFQSPSSLTNNADATFVLGQATFGTFGATTSLTSLNGPRSVVFSQNLIFVTDANSNRMVNFAITPGTPTVAGNNSVTFKYPKKKTFDFSVANVGATDAFTIGVAIPSDAKKLASVTFTYAGQDVTSELTAGTFKTSLIGPENGSLVFKAKVTPKAKSQSGGKFRFTVTATSVTNTAVSAQKSVGGKFKKIKTASPTPTPAP